MIIEMATIRVAPENCDAFEKAFADAPGIFSRADGCLGVELARCHEEKGLYQALIRWGSVEDHMVGFRESPLFTEWRELVGPFFASPPSVLHYEIASPAQMFD